MLGSAVVSLPWAFQQSGLLLGILISFSSFVVSWYTCSLIIDQTGEHPEWADILLTYYGEPGYYVALIAPAFLLSGAVTVYFVIMAQVLYPVCMAVLTWLSGNHYEDISALPDL